MYNYQLLVADGLQAAISRKKNIILITFIWLLVIEGIMYTIHFNSYNTLRHW